MKKRPVPKYSNEALDINDKTHFYECGRGLDFVVYFPDGSVTPARFILPWRMVEESPKRRRAVKAHRQSKR